MVAGVDAYLSSERFGGAMVAKQGGGFWPTRPDLYADRPPGRSDSYWRGGTCKGSDQRAGKKIGGLSGAKGCSLSSVKTEGRLLSRWERGGVQSLTTLGQSPEGIRYLARSVSNRSSFDRCNFVIPASEGQGLATSSESPETNT